MPTLYHHTLCPFSRRIRLAFGEIGYELELVEEKTWERRRDFLMMNPAGTLPVLIDSSDHPMAGIVAITEYVEEVATADGQRSLIPGTIHDRAEVRRLIEWFDVKFHGEVTQLLVHQKVEKRFMDPAQGGGGPNMEAVRVAKHNIRHHLEYVGYLVERRRWIAGDELSHADLAAVAHLSCVDYLGDVPWEVSGQAKDWYARVKSRPSYRPFLTETVRGIRPPDHYADLDF